MLIILALCLASCRVQRNSTNQLHKQVKLKVMLCSVGCLFFILAMFYLWLGQVLIKS